MLCQRSFRAWIALFVAWAGLSLAFAGRAVEVKVLSDDGRTVVLDYRMLDYQFESLTIDGKPFVQVHLPGEAGALDRGAPDLPHVSRDLVVPDDGELAVSVLAASYAETIVAVAPSKGVISRNVDPALIPHQFGPQYSVDSWYPATLAVLGEPYILRDHRGVAVWWSPFQYNPVSGVLRVYDHVTLQVTVVAPGGANVLDRTGRPTHPVRAFDELYRRHFANYEDRQGLANYPPIDENGELLIIAYDSFISDLDPLVAHKNDRGIPTTVVGVSTIGNDATQIKQYISNYYNSHNLAFVLLVGDSAQVATPLINGYDAGDPTYSQLAGADSYPEILVGRFSAQTAAQVDTQVTRTVEYEDMPAQSQAWYRRGIGIASDQGLGQGDEGQSDRQHEDQIRGWLLGDSFTLVDQIYDPGATAAMVTTAVNDGRGIINYTGHGSATSWGTTGFNTTNVNNLVNKDQLPFIISVACNNGEFNHYDPCFAEAWLRATKDGRPTGAVAVYMSSISQSWASPMEAQDEINLRFTDPARPYKSYGALCFAGSSSMMSAYGADGINMFNTWHIFGDPSLYAAAVQTSGLKVEPAEGLAAEGQIGASFSPASKDYTLTNLNSTAMDYEIRPAAGWVSSSRIRGSLAGNGSTVVTVSINEGTKNLDLGLNSAGVQFVNVTDHDGDASRPVSVKVNGALRAQAFQFDADPNWTREGDWQYGRPTGSGGAGAFNPDPTSGFTGANVYGVNLQGDFPANRPAGPYYLTAGPLNLSGITGVTLKFQRWLNTAGPPNITSVVQLSKNGATWTTLWSASGDVADNAWTQQSFDISFLADSQPAVYIRWGYQVVSKKSGPGAGSGWNIDDVELWAQPTTARISLNVSRTELSWTPIPGVPAYDVVRGDAGVLRSSGGDFVAATQACLANNTGANTLPNSDSPDPGSGLWYLVRGAGLSGALTYQDLAPGQVDGRDDEIAASPDACP